eukprot:m.43797 g.43797  ORF g.43797 m.43797 type:complete len:451 (+) comp19496_c0_seq1:349-1701(+)
MTWPSSATVNVNMFQLLILFISASIAVCSPHILNVELVEAKDINMSWIKTAVTNMLEPWRDPLLTKPPQIEHHLPMINRCGMSSCIVSIKNMELYGEEECKNSTRMKYFEHLQDTLTYLKRNNEVVGDQQIVLTEGKDEPVYPKFEILGRLHDPPPLLVSQTNNGRFFDMVFPTVARDNFKGNWQHKLIVQTENASNIPFNTRDDTLVWRGHTGTASGCGEYGLYYYHDSTRQDPNLRCCKGFFRPKSDQHAPQRHVDLVWEHPRMRLVKYSEAHPTCLDALFVSMCKGSRGVSRGCLDHRAQGNTTSPEALQSQRRGHEFPRVYGPNEMVSFVKHKYVLSVGNNGFADRIANLLANGNLLFKVSDEYVEWFYPLLKPMVNFVPIKYDLSDVCEKITLMKNNPVAAETMARNAVEVIKHLTGDNVRDEYIAEILRQYGEISNRWARNGEI